MTRTLLRAGAIACALMTTTCLTPAPALAQYSWDARERQAPDENGVDVITGQVNVPLRSVTVGTGQSALTYAAGWAGGTFYDLFDTRITAGTGTSGNILARIFGAAKSFAPNGTNAWLSNEGDGETITYDPVTEVHTYRMRDGTLITFKRQTQPYLWLHAEQITRPDGEVITFHYRAVQGSVGLGGSTLGKLRVQSVTSNLGYQIKATYASNVDSSADFAKLASVAALNNAVDYCSPTADSCTYTQNWPRLELAASTSGSTVTRTFTDRLSNVTTIIENSTRLTSLTSPADSAQDVSVGYDTNNRVSSLTRGGGTWGYSYSDALVGGVNQRTTTVTQPGGGSRIYVSNLDTKRVLSITDEGSRITSFQYDSLARPTRITRPEGNYTQLTYDTRGNVTETRHVAKSGTGLADIVTSAAFPSSCTNPVTCNSPTSVTDARGNATAFTYDSTHGGVLTATAPAVNITVGGTTYSRQPQARFTYGQRSAWYKNSAGNIVQAPSAVYRLTETSTCQTGTSCAGTADEVKTVIDYGTGSSSQANNLLVASVTSGSGNGSVTATSAFGYDVIGNLTSVDGPLSGNADKSGFRYDAERRLTMEVSADPDGGGSLPHRARQISYNGDGNVTKVELGTTSTLTGTFTAASSGERVEFGYDSLGRRVSEKLVSGTSTVHALTQTSFDTKGRLECTAQRMNPAEFGSLPSDACTLDTAGTGASDFGPDRITRNYYDTADRLTSVRTGFGVSGVEAVEATMTYRNNGQVETLTDSNSNLTTYEFDGHDRLVKTRFPSPSTANSSSTTDYEQLTLDANGNVTNLRLRDGQNIGFTLDALNRVTLKNAPGSEPDVTYSYDLLGRLTGVSQTGHALTFTYDALGRNVTQAGPQGTVTSAWDQAGRRTRLTYPGGSFYVDYDYHDTGEMTKIRENGATSGVGVLATFGYDSLGRRTSLTRGNGLVTTYDYDAVSRLDELADNPYSTSFDQTVTLARDPASGIVGRTGSNDTFAFIGLANLNRTDTHNGLNQVTATGSTSVTHDARGNTNAIGSTAYAYDSQNRMTTGAGVAMAYDPVGRLYDVGGSTRFVYDGLAMIEERNGSGTLVNRFVHGPGIDEPIVWYEGSTQSRRWYHADERGSALLMTDVSGAAYHLNRYDEYGQPYNQYGRFGYTGQVWISEIGLGYYKARMYNPTLGRFMQTDPIGGTSPYAYPIDPVNFVDPLGLCGLQWTNVYDVWNGDTGEYVGQAEGPRVSRPDPTCDFGSTPSPSKNPAPKRGGGRGSSLWEPLLEILERAQEMLGCSISAGALDEYLRSKDSPMSGLGEDLITTGSKFGIDPRLLIAIAGGETGFGRNITWGRHNAWNWGWNTSDRRNSPFDSWQSGMTSVA
jgi:RHS repeat-associated protein